MHHPDVAGKEEIGQRRKREPFLVERPRDRAALLPGSLDQHLDDLRRRVCAQSLGQLVVRDDVHRLADQEIARLRLGEDLAEQVAHLVHAGETPEHRDELAMLALGDLEVDDVVVEIVGAVAGRDRLELAAGRVDQHGLERTDLGGDVTSMGEIIRA